MNIKLFYIPFLLILLGGLAKKQLYAMGPDNPSSDHYFYFSSEKKLACTSACLQLVPMHSGSFDNIRLLIECFDTSLKKYKPLLTRDFIVAPQKLKIYYDGGRYRLSCTRIVPSVDDHSYKAEPVVLKNCYASELSRVDLYSNPRAYLRSALSTNSTSDDTFYCLEYNNFYKKWAMRTLQGTFLAAIGYAFLRQSSIAVARLKKAGTEYQSLCAQVLGDHDLELGKLRKELEKAQRDLSSAVLSRENAILQNNTDYEYALSSAHDALKDRLNSTIEEQKKEIDRLNTRVKELTVVNSKGRSIEDIEGDLKMITIANNYLQQQIVALTKDGSTSKVASNSHQ